MGGFVTPGTAGIESAVSELSDKFQLNLPGTGSNTVEIPMIESRLQVHNRDTNQWLNLCAFDPVNPTPPGFACAAWVKAIDDPSPIRVQLIDAATGNASLFFSGTPSPGESGFGVRLVPSGQEPMATSESVVLASDHPSIVVRGEPYSRTSFGQARVATTYTLFDGVATYGLDARLWGTQTATGGTVAYDTVSGATALTVTSASGSSAIMRTHTYFLYQAGKTQRSLMTVYHADAGQANQVRRWGQFETNDGLFFELAGTDLRVVRRSSVSGAPIDTPVARASWNGDRLDGTGVSGVMLDVTKANIYEIDLQWLSVGLVRFFINGILVHTIDNPNTLAEPYMRTAQLPLQLEVTNTGASIASSMRVICSAVSIDGGEEPAHVGVSRARSTSKTGIPTSPTPVLSFRVAALFGGRQNRKIVLPKRVYVTNTSGRASFQIMLNATLVGASWVAIGAQSGVEYDESATSMSGGTVVLRSYLPAADDSASIDGQDFFTLLGSHLRCPAFGGAGDIMTIAAASKTGTVEIDASAAWYEIG